jgi:hypothetical protein
MHSVLPLKPGVTRTVGLGQFMERYTTMYPCGQPGLPDDPVTAYVNSLRAIGTAPGSATTRGARTMRRHDPMRECNVCVASSSGSSEQGPAPRHRGANDQWRARLDELAEVRRQLDEELAFLRQELGVDAEPRDRQPEQDVSCVGGAPRGEWQPAHLLRQHTGQRSTTTDAPTRARTPTLTLCHFSAGVSEHCRRGHAAARLPGACNLRGAAGAPTAEGAARGSSSAASEELHLAPELGAQAGWSAIRPRPESASFPASRARRGSQSRGIGGQESAWAQPRRSEHHRGPTTS